MNKKHLGSLLATTAVALVLSVFASRDAAALGPVSTQITTDGTVGSLGVYNVPGGPTYQIPASAGTITGNNLFHSFSTFNVGTSDTAQFLGPSSVQNVISRVTGGTTSIIDGSLDTSAMPNASLFLINPNGLIFGPNAKITNVRGSFYATTADFLSFGASQFSAHMSTPPVFSAAAPKAFGFLGPSAGSIQVTGSQLALRSGKSLSLVGGDISIDSGAFVGSRFGFSAGVNLFSAASAGQVTLDGNASSPTLGSITVSSIPSDSLFTTVQAFGGPLRVRSDSLFLDAASILVLPAPNNKIDLMTDIQAKTIDLHNSIISQQNFFSGNTGTLSIKATDVSLWEASNIDSVAFAIFGGFQPDAGKVSIDAASSLRIFDGSVISSSTFGSGNAAAINISTQSLVVSGTSPDGPSRIEAQTVGADTTGNAGVITIDAHNVNILDGATITVSTSSTGNGGQINLTGEQLIIVGSTIQSRSLIDVDTGIDGGGAGGSVTIHANTISATNGTVTTATETRGNGGAIEIIAGQVLLEKSSTIAASSSSTGRAGDISITATAKFQSFTSTVETSTSQSDGGSITISAGSLIRLDGSRITTTVNGGSGNGGNILIDPQFVVLNNSSILANAFGGHGGNIHIIADNLIENPSSNISASSQLGIDGAIAAPEPNTTVGQGLASVSLGFLDASSQLRSSCTARRASEPVSSLVGIGRGVIPSTPREPLIAYYGVNPSSELAALAEAQARIGPILNIPPSLLSSSCLLN